MIITRLILNQSRIRKIRAFKRKLSLESRKFLKNSDYYKYCTIVHIVFQFQHILKIRAFKRKLSLESRKCLKKFRLL